MGKQQTPKPVVEEQVIDPALEQGESDAADATDEGAGSTSENGDSTQLEQGSQEGEADAGAGSDSESSDDDLGEESDEGPDAETAQLEAALAAAASATQQPSAPVNDTPEVVEPVAPVGSDIPESDPVAAPTERAPSVSVLKPVPVKVDVKAQQAEIKFQLILDRLNDFAAKMAPNAAISETDGKAQQLALWRVIMQVLELEGAEFIKGFGLLLDFFAAHRDKHFSDKYIYRFFGPLAMSAGEKRNFNRLLNLFVATADKATRRLGLEQVDLQASLSGIRNTDIQQRVTEFYQI